MEHGLTLVFSELQVLLSHLWEKEKEGAGKGEWKEGKREWKRKGRKEEGMKKIGGKIRRNFNKN